MEWSGLGRIHNGEAVGRVAGGLEKQERRNTGERRRVLTQSLSPADSSAERSRRFVAGPTGCGIDEQFSSRRVRSAIGGRKGFGRSQFWRRGGEQGRSDARVDRGSRVVCVSAWIAVDLAPITGATATSHRLNADRE